MTSSLPEQLRELQNKPYKTRLKILWLVVGITAILVIAIWIITLKYRATKPSQESSKFQPLIENFNKLKNIFESK